MAVKGSSGVIDLGQGCSIYQFLVVERSETRADGDEDVGAKRKGEEEEWIGTHGIGCQFLNPIFALSPSTLGPSSVSHNFLNSASVGNLPPTDFA
jgi:hypothetical protein